MLKLGMVGWRGMVGSVLMDRMMAEKDFDFVSTTFFSTSNAGGKAPDGAQCRSCVERRRGFRRRFGSM